MTLDYTLLTLALALAYGILVNFLPDFPLTEQVLLGLIIYVLGKLGVEVIGKPAVRRFLPRLAARFEAKG